MFTEAPFAIAKTWERLKQPKRPSTDKGDGVCVCVCVCVYTHNGIYLLSHKKEWKKCHLQLHGWTQRLSY